ncbi:MAG: integrase core domain-containing protein [Gammaproteobacteria bacterium]|nr:integrase core domain-containing protein [Gammaproteobacteria bacterium]
MADKSSSFRLYYGKEFAGKAMRTWAHLYGMRLRLIESGKPNQNANMEAFNSRFRDEGLNEHWFFHLRHARELIEHWRTEYNERRSKKALDG